MFRWTCPNCSTELELRKRVTRVRRYCLHCNFEVLPSEIDRQRDEARKAAEIELADWQARKLLERRHERQSDSSRRARDAMHRFDDEKQAFVATSLNRAWRRTHVPSGSSLDFWSRRALGFSYRFFY